MNEAKELLFSEITFNWNSSTVNVCKQKVLMILCIIKNYVKEIAGN